MSAAFDCPYTDYTALYYRIIILVTFHGRPVKRPSLALVDSGIWKSGSTKTRDGRSTVRHIMISRASLQQTRFKYIYLYTNTNTIQILILIFFHWFVCLLLFYAIATIFRYIMAVIWCMRLEGESLSLHFYQLKRYLTSHPTPYRHGMRGTDFWWCCMLYTAGKWIAGQLNVIAITRIHTPVPRVTYTTL